MAISRQSDSIWAMGAMGYGRQHSPARQEDHYGIGSSSHDYGEALGRKHAGESIDHYHRDAKGRFAPMPHHESEREHEANRIKNNEHRDSFHEGYERGFHGKIKEHELAEKEKANKTSMVREAVKVDPFAGGMVKVPVPHQVEVEDPGRFHYRLTHGGSDKGYVPPSWLETTLGSHGADEVLGDARHPTEKYPYRHHTDVLANTYNHPKFGLNLGLSEKAPFSKNDVGLPEGNPRLKANREYAQLRSGDIASRPIQVTDHLGNVHTFVHHISAPNNNPMDPKHPENGGKWVVSLHHHVKRADGTADWLPSETSDHVDKTYAVRGRPSDNLLADIGGQLRANSDMVSLYGAGFQRIGDPNTSIEYEAVHPSGQVKYRAKAANRYNVANGYHWDEDMPENHREALKGGPQWIVTGHGVVRDRRNQFDPNADTHTEIIEGSDHPSDQTISYPLEDIPGVVNHVWGGFSRPDRPEYTRMQQNFHPGYERGGEPSADMIRGASVRPWQPEYNIHRSAERPGLPRS